MFRSIIAMAAFGTSRAAQFMCEPSYFIGTQAMTFGEADAYCQSQGAELASIRNDDERDEVKALCKTYDNVNSHGCWIGLHHVNGAWSWTDGSSLGYGFDSNGNPTTGVDPWYPGEPNNHDGVNEDCGQIFEGQDFNWNDQFCWDTNHPICRRCEPSYFIGPDVMTFDEAQGYCESYGGTLATIRNGDERDAVKELCRTYYSVDSIGCWIGLHRADGVNGAWSWSDGSALEYGFDNNGNPTTGVDPWYPGEPNNVHEGCVHVYESQGFNWNDVYCYEGNHPICNY